MCLRYKSIENTVGKGEIAQSEQFLLCPQCFLPFPRILCHFYHIPYWCLKTLSVLKCLKLVVWERVNLGLENIIWKVKMKFTTFTIFVTFVFHLSLPFSEQQKIYFTLSAGSNDNNQHNVENCPTATCQFHQREINLWKPNEVWLKYNMQILAI